MSYQKDIDNFIRVVSTDDDIDLTTFYENLKTLKIGIGKNDLFNMGYDNVENSIFFGDDETYDKSINHELFHVASNKSGKKIIHSGFYSWDKQDKRVTGLGLNEGYTEILQRRYFNKGKGYPIQIFYIEKLEQIINPLVLKKAYFATDLSVVINELKKYAKIEDIQKFITNLDVYTITLNPNQKKRPYSFEQVQEAITYCSCFLADTYVKKVLLEQQSDIVNKVFTYFGGFDKRFRFENYPEINIAVPLEQGFEILGNSGFKRKQ